MGFHGQIAHTLRVLSALTLSTSFGVSSAAAQTPQYTYIGEIRTFAFNYCPAGFLPADGRLVNISTYTDLFSVIGTTYGSGPGQFALPNLIGRSVIGAGTPTAVGTAVGNSVVTLQPNQVPLVNHIHNATFTPVTQNKDITVPATQGTLTVTPKILVKQASGLPGMAAGSTLSQGGTGPNSAPIYAPASTAGTTVALGGVSADIAGVASTNASTTTVSLVTGGSVTISPSGAAATQPVPTQSPALVMSVCIAPTGIYPTRP